jgi:glycosyltransferase involved in cell wall biosynthesis
MTEEMKKDLSAFSPSRGTPIIILPNDLPAPDKATEPAQLPEGQFVILSSGVIDERKNVGLLVNSCALLLRQNLPDHVLLFAGSGPLAEHYKGLAASFGLTNVQFLGWQESLIPYLKRAQLVLHPSFHEGMPNSVMEALAYDCPVLLSDTPELRELIFYDELLFDPYNAEALAARLAPLIRNRSLLAPLLELSRKRSLVYSFNWDERASQIVTAA